MPTKPLIHFNITRDDGDPSSVTAFIGGKTLVATKTHPNFDKILAAFTANTPPTDGKKIAQLFDVGVAITDRFVALGEQVSIRAGVIYLDHDPLDGALAKAIVTFYMEGNEDFIPLVKFLHKVAANPVEHSRKQLYDWLDQHSFGIAEDGDFIAYKGVHRYENGYRSSSHGNAIVNGVPFKNQKIPTLPGSIVEMPRSQVTADPNVACSTGLHAGNWRYARSFAPVTLRVKINPRDVVSVPRDSVGEKIRVCRYQVLGEVTKPDTQLLFPSSAIKTLVLPDKVAAESKALPKPNPATRKKLAPPAAVKPTRGAVKKAVAKKAVAKKAGTQPNYYEDFKKADFLDRPFNELRWLAKQWEVKAGANPTAVVLAEKLAKKASAFRRKNAVLPPRSKKRQRTALRG